MDSTNVSISWDSFLKAINDMKMLSDSINDDWLLNEHSAGVYLSKKLVKSVSARLFALEECDNDGGDNDVLITYEYHVVYNASYGCPVLCFNAWKTDGSLLTIEECWKQFNFANADYKYNTLTQMEHPLLMRPFITLHPCKTSELIGTLMKSNNLVVSWLSAVGPVVGLDVSSCYASLTL
ncbi:ubiquitin-like-conjugating enzyme ATG10 [Photinus pyralis]|uniref:Ubiquitin-like-conjugating enzyme ATG10 n=1 Tax=Photinus pyralis TaxID=7054 RepID=A0A1Y1N6G1_PHOPY|nr:ubiquitin-like-conjugating enzyme ATG10 [Photinus pyralis]